MSDSFRTTDGERFFAPSTDRAEKARRVDEPSDTRQNQYDAIQQLKSDLAAAEVERLRGAGVCGHPCFPDSGGSYCCGREPGHPGLHASLYGNGATWDENIVRQGFLAPPEKLEEQE